MLFTCVHTLGEIRKYSAYCHFFQVSSCWGILGEEFLKPPYQAAVQGCHHSINMHSGTQVTSGARSDFQQATREARHMVTECGMSDEIGPVFVENTESPDMRRRIDGEVSRILREAYNRVTTLLVSSSRGVSHVLSYCACLTVFWWLKIWRYFSNLCTSCILRRPLLYGFYKCLFGICIVCW